MMLFKIDLIIVQLFNVHMVIKQVVFGEFDVVYQSYLAKLVNIHQKKEAYMVLCGMLPRVVQLFCSCNFMHCLFATSNFCSYYSELFFVHYALFRWPKYFTFAFTTWSSFPFCPVYIAETPAHPMWLGRDLWHLSKHLKCLC